MKFMQSMAIGMYAFLPTILKSVIVIAVVAAGGAEGFTFQNPVASNLSGLADPNSSHFLYSILTSLDIFSIWTLILTGIGYSCITKVKRGTCMGVVFGWWAVVALVGAGIGALTRVTTEGVPQAAVRSRLPFWSVDGAPNSVHNNHLGQTELYFGWSFIACSLPPFAAVGAFS